jgi:hypothetical protein
VAAARIVDATIPDSKTGAKTVHLGDAAVALLEALPRVRDNPYVIAGKKEKTHLTDLQHPWRRVRRFGRSSTITTKHSVIQKLPDRSDQVGRLMIWDII